MFSILKKRINFHYLCENKSSDPVRSRWSTCTSHWRNRLHLSSHFIFAGTYMFVIHVCMCMCIHCNNDPYGCSPVWHHIRGRLPHFYHLSAAGHLGVCHNKSVLSTLTSSEAHRKWIVLMLGGLDCICVTTHVLQDILTCAWSQYRYQVQWQCL